MSGTAAALVVTGYLLGSLSTAYYLLRIRTGEDVRTLGSGTAGSTNVGRAMGASGFAVTFLADAGKGALAVLAARYLDLGPWGVVLVILAVVAGQVWPAHLGFKGGKGLATAVGATLLLDYRLMVVLAAIAAPVFLLLKRRMLGGLVAVALGPGVSWTGFTRKTPTSSASRVADSWAWSPPGEIGPSLSTTSCGTWTGICPRNGPSVRFGFLQSRNPVEMGAYSRAC